VSIAHSWRGLAVGLGAWLMAGCGGVGWVASAGGVPRGLIVSGGEPRGLVVPRGGAACARGGGWVPGFTALDGDRDEVALPGGEDRYVAAMARGGVGSWGRGVVRPCSCRGTIRLLGSHRGGGEVGRIDSSNCSSEAGSADVRSVVSEHLATCFFSPDNRSHSCLSLLPMRCSGSHLLFGSVPVSNVSLQISAGQISSPAPGVSIPRASLCAKEYVSKPSLFHPGHLVPAPRTSLNLLLATSQAEHMLAGNHPAIDEDRALALVAAVDHGVDHLLADQVELVIPL